MTEKLLTSTLNLNTNKQTNLLINEQIFKHLTKYPSLAKVAIASKYDIGTSGANFKAGTPVYRATSCSSQVLNDFIT